MFRVRAAINDEEKTGLKYVKKLKRNGEQRYFITTARHTEVLNKNKNHVKPVTRFSLFYPTWLTNYFPVVAKENREVTAFVEAWRKLYSSIETRTKVRRVGVETVRLTVKSIFIGILC